VVRELHENRELDKIASELASMGLPVDAQTYAGAQGEAVTGEKIPARFAWFTTKTKGGNVAKTATAQGDEGDDAGDAAAEAAEDERPGKSGSAAARASGLVEAPNLPAILEALRDMGITGGRTPTESWSNALADIGLRVQGATSSATISKAVASQAEKLRADASGVNLDEEAARLIQYQQSYQAAAKMLQVAQTLFQQLMDVAGN
jgi:flagellar hook-associated protein FlgK